MTRVAVLASGSGTNLQAILDQQKALGPAASAQVVLVASDHADSGAVARARAAGITAVALDKTARTSGLSTILASHRIELIALAGYMRLVPADVVAQFRGRILNVHPALLPAFGGPGMYGHHVHEAVIARGHSSCRSCMAAWKSSTETANTEGSPPTSLREVSRAHR